MVCQFVIRLLLVASEFPVVSFTGDMPSGFREIVDMKSKSLKLIDDYYAWRDSFVKLKLGDAWWESSNIEESIAKIRG